jgi:aminoglycoside phosphotransferase family enzyme/predicted kinase
LACGQIARQALPARAQHFIGLWHDRHTHFPVGLPLSAFPGHLRALLSARAYPHPVTPVELIETHVSWILLTGEYAYKIKRPVQHSFVDQRALEHRRFLCHEEVRLNRRFAPELYLGVCPIAVRAGEVQVEGPGPVIEYAVRMRQFLRSEELDQLLEKTRLAPTELYAFGRELAQIHARLPVAQPSEQRDHRDALATLILGNIEECARAGSALGWTFDLHPLPEALEALLVLTAGLRSERLRKGRVRECHGDLHTRNIVRHGSRLIAFDCLEFDPALRWIDVADEMAFLLADLDVRQRPLHAQAFLNGYLTESGDYQACALQPLFSAHRALVRAKITALSATEANTSSANINAARCLYEAYLDGARRAVAPKRPILVLMCGLSGSGKTWLAQRLAPALAAVHIRSDIERKRLAGLAAMDRSNSPVAEGLYSREASQSVYSRLAECAADALRGGYTTIVDATFGRAEERSRFRHLAAPLGLRSCVVYCHAPRQVLEARIIQRQRRQRDASEADLAVLAWQEGHFEAPEPVEGLAVLEAHGAEPAAIESLIQRITALSGSDGGNSPAPG